MNESRTQLGSRENEDLFDVLDRMAGVTEWHRTATLEQIEALDDQTITARQPRAPAVAAPAPDAGRGLFAPAPRVSGRRKRVMVAAALALLLASAAPVYFFVWNRKHIDNLPYEEALYAVMDGDTYPIHSRNVAVAKIAILMRRSASALRLSAASQDSAVQNAAREAIAELIAMCELPANLRAPGSAPPGSLEDMLPKRRTDDPQFTVAEIRTLVQRLEPGFFVLRQVRSDHPILEETVTLQLRNVLKRLTR